MYLEKIVDAARKYYETENAVSNGSDRSWEHCYKSFFNARNDDKPGYDYLNLHLMCYLGSWGMYSRKSFLLRRDYKVHLSDVGKKKNNSEKKLWHINHLYRTSMMNHKI